MVLLGNRVSAGGRSVTKSAGAVVAALVLLVALVGTALADGSVALGTWPANVTIAAGHSWAEWDGLSAGVGELGAVYTGTVTISVVAGAAADVVLYSGCGHLFAMADLGFAIPGTYHVTTAAAGSTDVGTDCWFNVEVDGSEGAVITITSAVLSWVSAGGSAAPSASPSESGSASPSESGSASPSESGSPSPSSGPLVISDFSGGALDWVKLGIVTLAMGFVLQLGTLGIIAVATVFRR